MSGNICNYEPIINLSIRDINRRLRFIHQYLCFLSSEAGSGGEGANGLSVSGDGDTVLGQDPGEVGNPGALTSHREIPMGAFAINFINDDASVEILAGRINISSSDAVASPLINIVDTDSSDDLLLTVGGGTATIQSNAQLQLNAQTVVANTSLGIFTPPTAYLTLGASTGAAETAPLKFTAGPFLSPSETGAMEFDGVDLTFTRNTDREIILTASAVTTETVVADTTVTVNYNGSQYKVIAQAI